jgi:hypothetical protein
VKACRKVSFGRCKTASVHGLTPFLVLIPPTRDARSPSFEARGCALAAEPMCCLLSPSLMLQIRAMQAEIQEQRKLLELEAHSITELRTKDQEASTIAKEGLEALVGDTTERNTLEQSAEDAAGGGAAEPESAALTADDAVREPAGMWEQEEGARKVSRRSSAAGVPLPDGAGVGDPVAADVSTWATQLLNNFSRLGRSTGEPSSASLPHKSDGRTRFLQILLPNIRLFRSKKWQ